jgi:hypothetical protein
VKLLHNAGNYETRMKKRKPKPFRATKAVKSAARALLGSPPPSHALPGGKKSPAGSPKHKITLKQLLEEE